MSVRNVLLFVFALFSAAMLGLAAGAVWMVVTLYLRHPLPWLALPIGALLASNASVRISVSVMSDGQSISLTCG